MKIKLLTSTFVAVSLATTVASLSLEKSSVSQDLRMKIEKEGKGEF